MDHVTVESISKPVALSVEVIKAAIELERSRRDAPPPERRVVVSPSTLLRLQRFYGT